MKRCFLSFTLGLLLVTGTSAQTKFGVQAGVSQAELLESTGRNPARESSFITTFYLKGYADFELVKNLSVQSGLTFKGKGGKEINPSTLTKFRYQALEIPVNLLYHFSVDKGDVYVGAGPFLDLNLYGNAKYRSGEIEEMSFAPVLESSSDEWRRSDYGVNFLGGYKLSNGVILNVNYSLGMVNVVPAAESKRTSRIWSFGVGYEF